LGQRACRHAGFLTTATDPKGDVIASNESGISDKVDGSNIILTVDRTLEATVCDKLKAAVKAHNATGGSAVIMIPATGAILAICSTPDFDPNSYNQVADPSVSTTRRYGTRTSPVRS